MLVIRVVEVTLIAQDVLIQPLANVTGGHYADVRLRVRWHRKMRWWVWSVHE